MKVKKTRPSDGVIINNLFTFATIVMISITIVLYTTFIVEKKPKLLPKLECEKNNSTFVRINDKNILKKSIKALNSGYYKIEGSILKTQKNSKIDEIITLEEINNIFKEYIKKPPKENLEKFLKIKYEIIENNLDSKSKLNAGSIMTSFKINSKEIFFIKTDFNFLYKNAIKERIQCSIKVYDNYVKNY